MSESKKKEMSWKKVVFRLWVAAGGRCQYPGCNKYLLEEALSKQGGKYGAVAHIVAKSPKGPRGDSERSELLANDFSNLMLLCPEHHTLIDRNIEEHPEDVLRKYKEDHERRIRHLTDLTEELRTHLVFFLDNIGDRETNITYEEAVKAIRPCYPALSEHETMRIDLRGGGFRDYDPEYFQQKQEEIRRLVEERVRRRRDLEEIGHLSIFALASIPLLVYFGYEIGDTVPSEVYQKHRRPNTWVWQEIKDQEFRYVLPPASEEGRHSPQVVVNLSLSGQILPEDIRQALDDGVEYSTYKLTVPEPRPDFLRTKEQLALFASEMRDLLTRIRETHREDCEIHLFPAIPNSVAVRLGQLILPKIDPPIHVYDRIKGRSGYHYVLTINPRGDE